ncbi:M23 family metallopeptidase [Spirochaeta africana]|uniref:Metalloendopeptidase-like membrane protein n=1 Tax=Spirochaeta africana (strain ATCC 700263 / DSM 8902 / Z-7692) TaxID=889378 RepID=H9UJ14_SPIAZ|nr:M23 family metallopeptidase [Spirochaeta africana]AFG37507.1 metalloendopeptidase-like membrane protein [Spirochaeta africana DSM 8902]
MKLLAAFLVTLLFFVSAAAAADFQGIVLPGSESDFPQGGAIAGHVADTAGSGYTVRLETASGDTEVRVRSFSAYGMEWFVLPLRFDLPPDDYLLRAIPHDPSAVQLDAIPVTVRNRDFPRQEIRLTREVSDLRRTVDPRREEESARLWEILSTTSEDALYHFGSMIIPLNADYRTTSDFAHQRIFLYDDGTSARSVHWGWDLAAPTGTEVVAPGGGRVVLASDRLITGNSIVLEHLPGMYSLFYHMDSLAVAEGDVVEPGAILGTVGSTGVSTGPHLHWELRIATVPVQPNHFLEHPLLDTGAAFPDNVPSNGQPHR